MKIKSLFSLLLLACVMTSCLDNVESHTTPEMVFGHLYVNPQIVNDTLVGAKDTLGEHYNMELGMTYLDTLQLGDTLMFPALFSSNMNNLVSINATYDTLRVNLWFQIDLEDESVMKALATGSKPERGVLLFNPMFNLVSFPVYIVPQEAGSYPIKLSVTSDSKYPTRHAIFTLPVK